MWVATEQGLATVDLNDGAHTTKIQSPDQATSLFGDAEGSIWIGSWHCFRREHWEATASFL